MITSIEESKTIRKKLILFNIKQIKQRVKDAILKRLGPCSSSCNFEFNDLKECSFKNDCA